MTVSLISRKAWGARYRDGFRDRPMPFKTFWLHHSVTIAPDLLPPFDDDDAAVRKLEDIGQSRFNGGISYNQPVTPVGRMYVGVSPHREGAHTYGNNTDGFAFVLVGDYSKREPTAIQQELIARRMVELHRAGLATRHTLNGGHRDSPGAKVYPTSCPGDAAHACIPKINARAEQLWKLGYPKNDVPLEGGEEDPLANYDTPEKLLKAIVQTDGVLRAPLGGDPRPGQEDNEFWWLETYLRLGFQMQQQQLALTRTLAESQGGELISVERQEEIFREIVQAAVDERGAQVNPKEATA